MGLLNTDPAVRLNATFSPGLPARRQRRDVDAERRARPRDPRLRQAARHRHLELRLGRQQGGRLGQRSDSVLGRRSAHRRSSCSTSRASATRRSSARSPGASGARKPIVAVKAGPLDRRRAGGGLAHRRAGHRATPWSTRCSGRPASSGPSGSKSCSTSRRCCRISRFRAGPRVAILTNAGGPGILAADACEANGLELPALGEATRAELRSFLPAAASVGNPVDMLASAPPDHYRRALAAILRDEPVDSVIAIFIPPLVTEPDAVAAAIAEGARGDHGKPVLGVFMRAEGAPGGARARFPATAFRNRRRWRSRGSRPTGSGAPGRSMPAAGARAIRSRADSRRSSSRCWPRRRLDDGGRSRRAARRRRHPSAPRRASRRPADGAVQAATRSAIPVALKALGPDPAAQDRTARRLPEPRDDADGLRAAYDDFTSRFGARDDQRARAADGAARASR